MRKMLKANALSSCRQQIADRRQLAASVVTPENTAAEVSGVSAFLDRAIDKLDLPNGPRESRFAPALQSQLGDRAMKERLQNALAPFSEKAFAIGDSWTAEIKLTTGLPMALSHTYTLVSRKKGQARAELASVAKMIEGKALDLFEMRVQSKMGGTQKGFLLIDEKTGMLLEAQIEQNFSGTMTTMGMEIPMEIASMMTVKTDMQEK